MLDSAPTEGATRAADTERPPLAASPFCAGDRVRLSNLGSSAFNDAAGVVLEQIPPRPKAEARWVVDVPSRPICLPALNLRPGPTSVEVPASVEPSICPPLRRGPTTT